VKIILINPYGPLPNEGWRKYRNILLGEELAQNNHDVVWYTSKFSHHFKKYRENTYHSSHENFCVELVRTKKYTKNISINRLLFEISYCINLYFLLKKEKNIDLIIAVDPPQFVGFLARILARKYKAKLILDLMDEWPELFEKALTSGIKKVLVKPIVAYFKFLRRRNYQKADGVIALGKNYLNIAKSISKKEVANELIYNGVDVSMMRKWAADPSLDIQYIKENLTNNNIKCVYAGSLGMEGDNYDVEALLRAATYFKDKNVDFYIAGSGLGKTYLLDQVRKCDLRNLFILGNLSAEKLARLYNFCDIGLALYGKGSNVDMPDKFYDYSSCGLAVVSSLKGELKDVIKENDIGYTYEAGNYSDLNDKLTLLTEDREALLKCKIESRKIGLNYCIQTQFKKIISLIDKI
jgi:glycosyltransferase involved in cell wall biosynthesis